MALLLLRSSGGIATSCQRILASATLTRRLLSPLKFTVLDVRMIVFSTASTASLCSRRPLAPQAENINPTMRISYRDCSIDTPRGKKLDFKYTKLPPKDFCTFMESTPKAEIVAFFRDIAKELECNRHICDFHMKIVDCDGGFRVQIYYGVEKIGPAVLPLSDCISCSPNALLFPGMEARECVLEEFSNHPYAVCRLDAKGRCGFIITPVRHVDRMSELDDEELFGLWSLAVSALRQANLPFTTMILNHGTYRTVQHLHLKVWVDTQLYEQYRVHWSNERQEVWKRVQDFASKRPRKRAFSKKILSSHV